MSAATQWALLGFLQPIQLSYLRDGAIQHLRKLLSVRNAGHRQARISTNLVQRVELTLAVACQPYLAQAGRG
jgi:hypothetical protein